MTDREAAMAVVYELRLNFESNTKINSLFTTVTFARSAIVRVSNKADLLNHSV